MMPLMEWAALVPELIVSTLEHSLSVYTRLFGFSILFEREGFAYLSLGAAQLMLLQAPGDPDWQTGTLEYPFGRGVNFQIEVPDVEAVRQRLREAEYAVKLEPQTNHYAQDDVLHASREFLVLDPDGYLLHFMQDLGNAPSPKSSAGDV